MPVEEYDELSKLVDRLLTEKAQLQLAVDKQADQLKVLMLFVNGVLTANGSHGVVDRIKTY